MANRLSDELMREAYAQSMEAQKSTHLKDKHYLLHKVKKSSGGPRSEEQAAVIVAFPGDQWDVDAWYNNSSFGETKIDSNMFPSLRSIGNNEPATVNRVFLTRFLGFLDKPSAGSSRSSSFPSFMKNKNISLKSQVEKYVKANKQIVFTGHSSGGPMAIFATLWFLENYRNAKPPHCVTFGSPLVGDRVLSHAVGREKWSNHFTHFVTEYDIVPRMMLSPLSSIEDKLPKILDFFKAHGKATSQAEARDFFDKVMWNTSAVASRVACDLMESANPLLDVLTSDLIEISPYRPFGTFIFCTGIDKTEPEKNKPVIVDDPNAALQLLFYFAELSSEEQPVDFSDSFAYEVELRKFKMDDVIDLRKPSSNVAGIENEGLNELSSRARLCLAAAKEALNRKTNKEEKMKVAVGAAEEELKRRWGNEEEIRKGEEYIKILEEIALYKRNCAGGTVGNYYDAFKAQEEPKDFGANVNRLRLANIWDEIIEMLKKYELPDEFEGRDLWVKEGTRFRELVEPLDIANYYRHDKGKETMSYLGERGRPKRYRYTQRWLEHANGERFEEISHTNFWAKVEQVKKENSKVDGDLEGKIEKWVKDGKLGKDVLKWCKRYREVFNEEFAKKCDELLA